MRAARILLCLLLVLTSVNAYGQGYRVLVTNDDGIESTLLDEVDVTVVAPHENQ